MVGRKALILAGTGMLRDVAEFLTHEGWHVVLPSRRYRPLACEPAPEAESRRPVHSPGRHLLAEGRRRGAGRAIWVEAQWDRPRGLAAKAELALHGPADLLVTWVHEQYRRPVLTAVESLLRPGAPVVEVRTAGGAVSLDPLLTAHPTQQILVGPVSVSDDRRSLGHAEITTGVVAAVGRALDGHAPSVHQLGRSRPVIR
jgi:hypothetical protein